MSRITILVLGLSNLALLGFVVSLLVAPVSLDDDTSMPPSAGATQAVVPAIPAVTDIAEDGMGRSMFGAGGMAVPRAEEMSPGTIPSPGSDLTLIGVLLADDGSSGHSASVLIRHGTPPQTARLPLGGTVDGWRVVSATRTRVKLVAASGRELTLDLGKSSPSSQAGR